MAGGWGRVRFCGFKMRDWGVFLSKVMSQLREGVACLEERRGYEPWLFI